MPEISIIVPVYKAKAYLNRCVDSILNQTFQDFELILVDDGSPDESGAICDAYAVKDSRVRVIHKPNGGVSSARNAGLDVAQGNWIAFVDSDDYVSETYLENLYSTEYDLVISGYIQVMSAEEQKTMVFHPFLCCNLDKAAVQKMLASDDKKWLYECWGKLFNKKIIDADTVRFDTKHYSGEDTLFVTEFFVRCTSVMLTDAADYYYVRRDHGSLSTTYDVGFLESMVQTEKKVVSIVESRFGIVLPHRDEEHIRYSYARYLGEIAADPLFSFQKKYEIFRYLFRNSYFISAVDDADKYFSGVSQSYRMLLRIKSPLLMLLGLQLKNRNARK